MEVERFGPDIVSYRRFFFFPYHVYAADMGTTSIALLFDRMSDDVAEVKELVGKREFKPGPDYD